MAVLLCLPPLVSWHKRLWMERKFLSTSHHSCCINICTITYVLEQKQQILHKAFQLLFLPFVHVCHLSITIQEIMITLLGTLEIHWLQRVPNTEDEDNLDNDSHYFQCSRAGATYKYNMTWIDIQQGRYYTQSKYTSFTAASCLVDENMHFVVENRKKFQL